MKRLVFLFVVSTLAVSCSERETEAASDEATSRKGTYEPISTGEQRSLDTRRKIAGYRNKPEVLWGIESLGLKQDACNGQFGGSASLERDDQVIPFGIESTGEVNIIYVGNRSLSRINPKRASTREPYWCRLDSKEYQSLLKASAQKERSLVLKNHSCLLPKSSCFAGTLDPNDFKISTELKSVFSAPSSVPRILEQCPFPYKVDLRGACRRLNEEVSVIMLVRFSSCPAGFRELRSTGYCRMASSVE